MKNNEIKYFSCQSKEKNLKIIPLSNYGKKKKKINLLVILSL